MTKVQDDALSACPVARAVDIVGDKWTILILRELYMGNTRFEEIQIQTEANPQLLAGRLKALEANEMIERKPYSERPLRYEYVLTKKGQAFYPAMYALRAWGETWCKTKSEGLAVRFVHKACGHDVELGNFCKHCGVPVERKDLDNVVSKRLLTERAARAEAFTTARRAAASARRG
ncbi:winged helix-turn-helix transcriptional regulator [Pandoraea sputorum]|uniref:Uncharacterized HTH-type transcriptional regulator yybR n=1 Tax=Pandoraea sputorum TaxID=93222 RepID=A0A239SJ46_9BURK|nr:helix-turn-helix domain-containing protein [Pandoraea sputorum]AJC18999.1 transcriptional regulator [Pandoraea sputorum]SNU85450.1 Uncharacterized HTH-type transcriptional regulator yybR [Pandoraea sputorum]VVD86657.1 transcriptional regulator [Pandoraea sputorum]